MTIQLTPQHWTCFEMLGPDARDFLARLSSADIMTLQPGEGTPACFLNAQGRIESFHYLWCKAKDEYIFEIENNSEGLQNQKLEDFIEKYHFGENFEFLRSQKTPKWFLLEEAKEVTPKTMKPFSIVEPGEEVWLLHHGSETYGLNWISVWGSDEQVTKWLKNSTLSEIPTGEETDIQSLRVEQLAPSVLQEFDEKTIPLELGLSNAISRDKGCYPGQEVIERIYTYGSPARRLVQIKGKGIVPSIGSEVLNLADEPVTIGKITSAIQGDSDGFTALAVIKKLHAKPDLEVRLSEKQSEVRISKVSEYEADA